MGIEPTRPAWKAGILPLNYTRISFSALILYHLNCCLSIGFGKVFLNIFICFFYIFFTLITFIPIPVIMPEKEAGCYLKHPALFIRVVEPIVRKLFHYDIDNLTGNYDLLDDGLAVDGGLNLVITHNCFENVFLTCCLGNGNKRTNLSVDLNGHLDYIA